MKIAKKYIKTATFEFPTSTGEVKIVRQNPRTKWQYKAVVCNRTGYGNWTGEDKYEHSTSAD
jgi:hypothetical protein